MKHSRQHVMNSLSSVLHHLNLNLLLQVGGRGDQETRTTRVLMTLLSESIDVMYVMNGKLYASNTTCGEYSISCAAQPKQLHT